MNNEHKPVHYLDPNNSRNACGAAKGEFWTEDKNKVTCHYCIESGAVPRTHLWMGTDPWITACRMGYAAVSATGDNGLILDVSRLPEITCLPCLRVTANKIEDRVDKLSFGLETTLKKAQQVGPIQSIPDATEASARPEFFEKNFPETEQAKRVYELMFTWWEEFVKKSADYQTSSGNVSENFGLMGQYMKLTDKIHKLRKSMWDAEVVKEAMGQGLSNPKPDVTAPFQFEGTEEILRDVIGHCFLALDFIAEQKKS